MENPALRVTVVEVDFGPSGLTYVELSCGHVYVITDDDPSHASLVKAEYHCDKSHR
jgi:hypothetical protein